MDDSFGQPSQFAGINQISDLMRKHNDCKEQYHFGLFEFVVIDSVIIPDRDIVRITLASLWMLANAAAFRAIIGVWDFQLNGDVTGNFVAQALALSISA